MQRTLTFRVLQDPEVDRESAITVATVLAAVAVGHVDRVLYWHEPLTSWVWYDPVPQPASVPLNTEFHLAVGWLNDGSSPMIGHMELTIRKPDGTQVKPAAVENQDRSANPGGGWIVGFDGVVLDQTGTYQATAVLSSGGQTLDTFTFNFAVVGVEVVAGEIFLYRFYNPNTDQVQETPPTITVGQEAGVVAFYINNGQSTQNMRLDMMVKAPDGTETTFTGEILVTDPTVTNWQFTTWVCDQVGDYKVTLILYAELA